MRRRLACLGAAALVFLVLAGIGFWTAPSWLVPRLAARAPECVYEVRTAEPVVALTIDDVPDPLTTPRIRALLERHEARATFFVITGQLSSDDTIVRGLVGAGHELGNHMTRDEPSIRLTPAEFEASLVEAGRALDDYAPVRWMRPGGGWFDSAMVATAARHGYRCAMGSVYPLDPAIPSPAFAARFILANVRPGSVIILHDRGGRGRRTERTLARVLPELRRRYRIVTLSELVDLAGTQRQPKLEASSRSLDLRAANSGTSLPVSGSIGAAATRRF